MQLIAFSVFDVKTGTYGVPFFQITVPAAQRAFGTLANDLSTTVGQYPTDYTLYAIGSYDDRTGKLEHSEKLQHCGIASQFITPTISNTDRPSLFPEEMEVSNGKTQTNVSPQEQENLQTDRRHSQKERARIADERRHSPVGNVPT